MGINFHVFFFQIYCSDAATLNPVILQVMEKQLMGTKDGEFFKISVP